MNVWPLFLSRPLEDNEGMKFTLRDLIWATLVVALLLVIGINYFGTRKKARELHDAAIRAQVLEREARLLVEQTTKSEEIARVRTKEAHFAQQQFAKQAEQLKSQLKHEQYKLSNTRTKVKHLEDQLAKKQTAKVVYGKSIRSKFPAKCVRVIDGDTIECLDEDDVKLSVQLEAIDTPESGEPYFQKAKQFTGELCHGKTVSLQITGKDRDGRTLAFVEVDGKNVSVELLKAGLAKHLMKYIDNEELAAIEGMAREQNVGLWQSIKN